MNPRSTKELTTPNGAKVVVYDYVTGGEMRKIQALFVATLTAGDLSSSTPMDKVPATIVYQAQDLALSILVVSVNGETKDAYQLVQNLKPDDLDYVIAEVDKLTSATTLPKKKLPESPQSI